MALLPSPSPKHHTYHQVSLSDDDECMEDATDFGGVTLALHSGQSSATGRSPSHNSNGNLTFLPLGCDMPSIALTPMMTPPSQDSLSPTSPAPLLHTLPVTTPSPWALNSNLRSSSPLTTPVPPPDVNPKDYFAYRDSIVQHVTGEVEQLVDSNDGVLQGTWFLTEIDTWDNELERIIVLTDKTILIVKYDFIGMKIEEVRRIHLSIVEKLIQGELKYPDKSLTPRLNGLAGGLAGMVKDVIPKVSGTVSTLGCAVLRRNTCVVNPAAMASEDSYGSAETSPTGEGGVGGGGMKDASKNSIMSTLSPPAGGEKVEGGRRNTWGIRLVWNNEKPVTLYQKWNPFDKSIPWITLTSHPLLWHKSAGKHSTVEAFDIETFSRKLVEILSHGGGAGGGAESPMCTVEYKPIVIETYVGLTSLLYNANSLGFYKVRGKVSF